MLVLAVLQFAASLSIVQILSAMLCQKLKIFHKKIFF